MNRSPFRPGAFVSFLVVVGATLLFFRSLRVAGLIAIILALTYWALMAVLRLARR